MGETFVRPGEGIGPGGSGVDPAFQEVDLLSRQTFALWGHA